MLITASSLPNKSELLDMLDKMAAKPQGPTPEQKAQLETLAAEDRADRRADQQDESRDRKDRG
jgi:hypothetical protein